MAKNKEEKKPCIELSLEVIKKKFGKGAIFLGNESDTISDVELIPTGSMLSDNALGGGYPRGRIIELYGPMGAGKTTLALHAIKEAQLKYTDKIAAFIDAEHALNMEYAKDIGIDMSRIIISQPDCGEEALEITEQLVRSGEVSIIVIDSTANLVPKAELDGDMDSQFIGLQARLISKAMRKLTALADNTKTLLLFISQTRALIGAMGYGPKETSTGGASIKYYSSQRIEVKRIGSEKIGETVIGNRTRIKVVKNKIAPPYREAEFALIFGKGVDQNIEIIELGEKYNILTKSGPWYSYGDNRIGQGKNNAASYLEEHLDIKEEIKSLIIEQANGLNNDRRTSAVKDKETQEE